MPPEIQRHDLFAVPLFQVAALPQFELHQQALVDLAMQLARNERGVDYSNQRGYHSRTNLHTRGDPHVAWLVEQIEGAVDSMEGQLRGRRPEGKQRVNSMWVNVNERGGYNVAHAHAPHRWSGVFYVLAEQSAAKAREHEYEGSIGFLSPLPQATPHGVATQATFRPKDGELFVFPGWLLHAVYPHHSDHFRIAIAFNLDTAAA